MAKSMTGFGIGEYKDENYSISVECKTINHKYLDINPRIPRKISFLEDRFRQLVKEYISRGRMDAYIKFDVIGTSGLKLDYDRDLAKQYYNIISDISENVMNNKESLNTISPIDIARFPDVIKQEEAQEDEEKLWYMFEKASRNALEKLCNMRVIEGEKLKEDILLRSNTLESSIQKIENFSDTVVDDYRLRLETRLSELLDVSNKVDESRLAQEIAIFADKSSITEEIVRFKSHIIQMRDAINIEDSIGRKMDFLIQEMNREVNTIGSKSSDINITNLVIQIKSELEKIREQIQNIE